MKKLCLLILCSLQLQSVHAQGCSDAGFCTAGALHPTAVTDSSAAVEHILGISVSFGSGEQNTRLLITQLEWKHNLSRHTQLSVSLPLYIVHGNIGRHTGIGDPILALSNELWRRRSWQLKGTAGLRISLGNADASHTDGRPLPMPYQSNLGTTDIITGLSLSWKQRISVAAGWQQPFIQYNNNGYNAADYPTEPEGYGAYFSSRKLRRRGDILLRADANYVLRSWSFSAGPLLIVHLGQDQIAYSQDRMASVHGSEGSTLNLTGMLGYNFKRGSLELAAGSPVIVRKMRPDGLTRHFICTLRYEHRFR